MLTEFGFRNYPLQTIVILISLTAGTMLAMWLGQLITEQGIGNGVSIIIFGGIIAAHAAEHRQHTAVQGGILQLLVFVAGDGPDRCGHRGGAGRAAPHPGAVWQAGARHARQPADGGRRAEHARAAARELGGHDPVDLRRSRC